jgi:hypothetical protein
MGLAAACDMKRLGLSLSVLLCALLGTLPALGAPKGQQRGRSQQARPERIAIPRLGHLRDSLPEELQELRPKLPQVLASNHDFDDHALKLDTKIWIKNQVTGKEEGVSTADFAFVGRHFAPNPEQTALVGSGPYKDYVIGLEPKTGGLREFRQAKAFRHDLKNAIARLAFGPGWKAIVEVWSLPETARWSKIITSRGQSRRVIHEQLEKQLLGSELVNNVPPEENINPVKNPAYVVNGKTPVQTAPSVLKSEVMTNDLDEVQANGLGDEAIPVITPDGKGRRRMHLWGYADDDYHNFDVAVKVLSEQVKKERWKDVKIRLYFTGRNDPNHKPRQVVIMSNGEVRDMFHSELKEDRKVIKMLKRWSEAQNLRPAAAQSQ